MKKITIKDIADQTGLSKGAVSKALGGKKGVSESTRQTVLQTAKNMGYQVNTVAQALARSTMKLGIIIPSVWEEYYGELRKGIDKGLAQISRFNVVGEYKYYDGLYSSDGIASAMDELAETQVDGVILCPGSVTGFEGYTEYYIRNNIPVVLLGTDSQVCERVACIRVDSEMGPGTIGGVASKAYRSGDRSCFDACIWGQVISWPVYPASRPKMATSVAPAHVVAVVDDLPRTDRGEQFVLFDLMHGPSPRPSCVLFARQSRTSRRRPLP